MSKKWQEKKSRRSIGHYLLEKRRKARVHKGKTLTLLAPLVLLTNLLLLLRCEVVLDVEGLPDLFWGLALDHVGHGLAGEVKEGLDVEIVGRENELEEGRLVNIAELLVPRINIVLLIVLLVVRLGGRILDGVLAIVNNLLKDLAAHIVERDGRISGTTKV